MDKTIYCFGNLSVKNGDYCPDESIYLHRQKNGKCKVKIFNGPCEKPYVNRKFDNVENAENFVKSFISQKGYAKVEYFK